MSAEAVTSITTLRVSETITESPFYIPMTGPAARPRRSLKHDDTFIVLDSHGDIGASAGGPDGLFNTDTRYLARLELVLDDRRIAFEFNGTAARGAGVVVSSKVLRLARAIY